MRTIKIVRPTKSNIKAYGAIIRKPSGKPTAKLDLLSYWKQQAQFSFPARKGEVGFLTANPHPGIYSTIEAHLKTPELLVALKGSFNIPVAPPAKSKKDWPDLKKVKAFRVEQGEAILLNTGVWHWLPQPIGRTPAEILVVFSDNTSANDMLVRELDPGFKIKR